MDSFGTCATCTLCENGEAIAKPEYFLGIEDPLPLGKCRDLDISLAAFVEAGSGLCEYSRALSTLCGCPRSEKACSICGENMTRPQQLLDGLVDLSILDLSIPLDITCEYVESAMNRMAVDSDDCTALPIPAMEKYCGCPSTLETTDGGGLGDGESICSFCPGGEIVPPERIERYYVDNFYCPDLFETAKHLEKGSNDCKRIQKLSSKCGCPIPGEQ